MTFIAEKLGVSRNTVSNWISRENAPLDKLVVMQYVGVDVAYVVTGLRSTPAPPAAKAPNAAYKAGRSEVWVMVLEVAVDELNRRGLTLPGTKLVELVDLLADYAVSDQGEVDTALVARQIRLVA